MAHHSGPEWAAIEKKLFAGTDKLWSLYEIEITGGEPDVIGFDKKSSCQIFCDCSAESPTGRRSICYDKEVLDSQKENKPKHSAVSMANEMGVDILTEEHYSGLQQPGKFDLKTSDCVLTQKNIRDSGGALFCDQR